MIEFLISFIFSVGFLFLFITLGLNFTSGYIVHYATFAASRAYLVDNYDSNAVGTSDGKMQTEATAIFNSFALGSLGILAKISFNPPPTSSGQKFEYVGAQATFQRDLSMAGLGGGQKLNLTSDSFIGREPSRIDCMSQICNVMGVCGENSQVVHITVDDNGC